MVRLAVITIAFASFTAICMSEDDSGKTGTSERITDDGPRDEEIVYVSPTSSGNSYFAEHFDDEGRFRQKWIISEAKKDDMDEEISKYEGQWGLETPQQDGLKGDKGLILKSKAKHSAISARLDRPFVFSEKPFIVQYEVTFQEGQDCGGAYLKLLSQSKQPLDLRRFNDKTPYTIMFGPDKCGSDVKLHFIFRHKNPNNGTLSEKHCKKPKERVEEPYKDKRPHLYSLHLRPDNTFTVYLDQKVINEGNLLEDFTPPVNPPSEIEDPEDKKPQDWDEREKIPDPEARKPDDWDEDAPPMIPDEIAVKPDGWLEEEPEMIPDPNAEKPEDWDTDMDGEWEAPLISNPVCEGSPGCGPWKRPMINNPAHKGKWRPPLIDNPNYKGKWKPRQIPNPDFFEDLNPFKMTSIGGLGFELWSMSNMILFDNIIVTDDPAVADRWAAETFGLKIRKLDKDSDSMWDHVITSLDYRHSWWALYFVYCLIPVAVYVWYLWRRVAEVKSDPQTSCRVEAKEGVVMRLVNYTNERPWLWAVYVIVIGLPIVMLVVFCCGSSQEKAEVKRAADAKKTDAVTPDDEEEEEEIVEETRSQHKASPTSKSDLELPDDAIPNKTDIKHVSDGEAEHINDEEEEEEEEEEDEEEEEEEDDDDEPPPLQDAVSEGAGDAPRSPKKVRPRKE